MYSRDAITIRFMKVPSFVDITTKLIIGAPRLPFPQALTTYNGVKSTIKSSQLHTVGFSDTMTFPHLSDVATWEVRHIQNLSL
jgi:hypothetical protein